MHSFWQRDDHIVLFIDLALARLSLLTAAAIVLTRLHASATTTYDTSPASITATTTVALTPGLRFGRSTSCGFVCSEGTGSYRLLRGAVLPSPVGVGASSEIVPIPPWGEVPRGTDHLHSQDALIRGRISLCLSLSISLSLSVTL